MNQIFVTAKMNPHLYKQTCKHFKAIFYYKSKQNNLGYFINTNNSAKATKCEQIICYWFWLIQKKYLYTMNHLQILPNHTHQQPYLQLPLTNHQQNTQPPVDNMTKRSDDEEFQDWQITAIRSGKFIFNPLDKPKAITILSTNNQNSKVPQLTNPTQSEKCSQSEQVKLKEKESNVVCTLQSNRLIRLIFLHFCKENHISSMKSTLFEQKQKLMQEMNLNKWMVFCKEFQFLEKLASPNTNISESQLRTAKAKQLKDSEAILTNIFKRCSENQQKMTQQHFKQGIKMVHEKFKQKTPNLSQSEFTKIYLFCSNEKECMSKLSSLKFTFCLPKIDYTVLHPKSMSKSKCNLSSTKQNRNSIVRNRSTHVFTKQKMKLHPIIRQIKNTVKVVSKPSLQLNRKYTTKIKLTEQAKTSNKMRNKQTNELQRYLDGSKDEILQAYLKMECQK